MGARRWATACALVLLVAACSRYGPTTPKKPPTALERGYPALTWAPADSSWVVTSARLSDAVTAWTELIQVWAVVTGQSRSDVARVFRERIGINPFVQGDASAAGLDLAASFAAFGQDGFPTVVFPVADGDKLRAFLDRVRPENNASVTQHRGHQVYTFQKAGWTAAWVVLDGWLVVRLARTGDEELSWLDRILAAASGTNMTRDRGLLASFERARKAGQGDADAPGLLALARSDRLVRALSDHLDLGKDALACAESLAGAFPAVTGWGHMSWDGASGTIRIALDPAIADALRARLAAPSSPGYYAYREQAALSVSSAIDASGIEAMRKALGCSLWSTPVTDPIRAFTGSPGPKAIYAAATDIDIDGMDGAGIIDIEVADWRLIDDQLSAIPGRSFFERKKTIAGVSVRSLSVPGIPDILYRKNGQRFLLSLGRKAIEVFLATTDHPVPEGEIVHLAIRPGRLPNLDSLIGVLDLVGIGYGGGRDAAGGLARRLARYADAELSIRLEGRSLAISAAMRLSE